jgi:preprotein translocase subunit SecD
VWWVVVAALVLTGCGTEVAGAPKAVEPVDLAVRFDIRPVLADGELTTEPTIELPGPDDERLTMLDPILTVERLDRAEVEQSTTSGTWLLTIDLTDADAAVFGDWTSEHTGERLAIVADDEVLIAPQIQSAILDGQVQITGNYSRTEVQALLDKLTER